MKILQLIFIFAIIGYCLTDDKDSCTKGFEEALENKCTNLDTSCMFKRSNYSEMCISKTNNVCSKGLQDRNICKNIFHGNFPEVKCNYIESSKECNDEPTTCGDFKTTSSSTFSGIYFDKRDRDLCDGFKSQFNGKVCLLNNNGDCTDFYPSCQSLTSLGRTVCNNNYLLPGYKQECYWDDGDNSCKTRDRKCDDIYNPIKNVKKDECLSLKTSTPETTRCVYSDSDGTCEAKSLCVLTRTTEPSESDCTSIIPLTKIGQGGGEYDYKYKCSFVSGIGTTPGYCTKVERTCDEYNGNDPSICIGLKAKDTINKRCVYDGGCKEVYKTCKHYSDYALNKNRNGCEKLKLLEDNVQCVYNIEQDICMNETIYTSCEQYTGISKKICESIKPSPHSGCILDKDSKCKERTFLCSEVNDYENCLYYAKASTSNKRCEFKSATSVKLGECYEEYLRCEDYIGESETDCENIVLHNGKICIFDSKTNRCRTENKTCSEAGSREECELIAKSGVSDPDKFVCHWSYYNNNGNQLSYPSCYETYKYCSDYRGENSDFCQNSIHPYNETDDKIDITSKCKYETDIGCQKVNKECRDDDVKNNPVLCGLISPKIQDNKLKYCSFINGECTKNYKTCEDWDESDTDNSCSNIIPQNYLDKPCGTKVDNNGKTICYTTKVCNAFPINPLSSSTSTYVNYYKDLCLEVGHDCEYSNEACTTKKELTCNDIKFYKYNDENEETCKKQNVSVFYNNCILKEDKSGCEEILNISYIIPPLDTSTPNAATFFSKGTQVILILLCLLI